MLGCVAVDSMFRANLRGDFGPESISTEACICIFLNLGDLVSFSQEVAIEVTTSRQFDDVLRRVGPRTSMADMQSTESQM